MNSLRFTLRLDWTRFHQNGTVIPSARTAKLPTRFPVLYEAHLG